MKPVPMMPTPMLRMTVALHLSPGRDARPAACEKSPCRPSAATVSGRFGALLSRRTRKPRQEPCQERACPSLLARACRRSRCARALESGLGPREGQARHFGKRTLAEVLVEDLDADGPVKAGSVDRANEAGDIEFAVPRQEPIVDGIG